MIKEKWQELGDRERFILWVGVPLAVTLLLYLLVWRPLSADNAALEQQIAGQQRELVWMQGAAAQIRQLQSQRDTLSSHAGSPQARINRLAATNKLKISRLQPGSQGMLSIWMDSVAFNHLLTFFDEMHRQGLTIENLTLRKLPTPGQVKVKLVVKERV